MSFNQKECIFLREVRVVALRLNFLMKLASVVEYLNPKLLC